MSVVLVTSHVVMKRRSGAMAGWYTLQYAWFIPRWACFGVIWFMPGGLWLYMVYTLQCAATVMSPITHRIEMFSIACCVLCWLTLQVWRNVDSLTEDDDLSNRW